MRTITKREQRKENAKKNSPVGQRDEYRKDFKKFVEKKKKRGSADLIKGIRKPHY